MQKIRLALHKNEITNPPKCLIIAYIRVARRGGGQGGFIESGIKK